MTKNEITARKNIKGAFNWIVGGYVNARYDGEEDCIPALEEVKNEVYYAAMEDDYRREGSCLIGAQPREMRFAGEEFCRAYIEELFENDGDVEWLWGAEEEQEEVEEVVENFMTYTRWNILRSEVERFTEGDVVLVADENEETGKPTKFGVNWRCKGTASVEETKAFMEKLELVSAIAEELNDIELEIVYEDDESIKTIEDCESVRDIFRRNMYSASIRIILGYYVQTR